MVVSHTRNPTLKAVLLPLATAARLASPTRMLAIVWFVLCGAALVLVLALPDVPDGLLPFTVLLCAFLLGNYSFVVCGAVHLRSEGAMTVVIVVHNIAISLFMFAVGAVGDISRHMQGPVPVWNSAFWTVLALEIAVFLMLFALPFLVAARRRDFI
jgi:hypothetical protein